MDMIMVLEQVANYFSCIDITSPKSIDVSVGLSILYIAYYKALPIEKYLHCGSIIITECWVSQWAQIYFLNRVCGTSCMAINLSAEYFGLSKNSITRFGRGLFALLHHVCSFKWRKLLPWYYKIHFHLLLYTQTTIYYAVELHSKILHFYIRLWSLSTSTALLLRCVT